MLDDRLPTTPSEPTNEILKRVLGTAEVITGPDSETLKHFHTFLGNFFKPEEVEPLEVWQRELANKNPDVRYILTALRDPKDQNKLVSAAYGSVQNGILAVRFTLTETHYRIPSYSSPGVSQTAIDLLINEAKKFCEEKTAKLQVYVCEAVDTSEGAWNAQEIEPGNGMRRIYLPETGEEIHYELPPLAWNPDGTPTQEGVNEHLQIAVKGYPEKVPVPVLEKTLKDWWKEWYIRPREQFESDKAWELHKKTVWDILETKVLVPMRQVSELTLMSKQERKTFKKEQRALSK